MIKRIVLGCVLMASVAYGQEEVGPIMGNPALQAVNKAPLTKVNEGTFDSTFIYKPDTIDLPIFDDFSSDKFQVYDADFSDPGVTSEKIYRVMDGANPIASDVAYTTQVTIRKTWVISTSTSIDEDLPAGTLDVGDLSSYPVIHVPTDVYFPYFIFDTVDVEGDVDLSPDTTWLVGPDIFQDSATQFFTNVVDPELIWMESEAFHNYTFAVNPWTLGVVTFDGLDENGYPYDFGGATSGVADHLTSKPIDLSGVTAADSLYISFLFQPEGFGDIPEVSSDSLVLEFYAKDLLQWDVVWVGNAGPTDDFKVGHIRLDNPEYFKKGFQFRFKNYGGLSGSLDHFHLDYVNLRTLSGYQDTLFKDFAIVYPVNTLIEDYTSVPWDHWKNNFAGKMSSDVEVTVRNGSNIDENNANGTTEIFHNATSEGSFTLVGQTLSGGNINYGPRTTYTSYHDFSGGYHYDETKVGNQQVFDFVTTASAPFPNFTGNDSTYSQQVFENYYAYDDGTAEKAYGPTGVQALLAIQYTPYEADSVIGMKIHWVPSVNDVSDNILLLSVWGDNGGQPGALLYEDEFAFSRQPSYEYDRNLFTTYYFNDLEKVPVDGTFYVGWRQLDADRLNVGLDANIVNNDKTFFSVNQGATWNQSSIEGSVMIRPIFSTALDDDVLGIQTVEAIKATVNVYPNPTADIVTIEVEHAEYEGVEVYNLQGVLIERTKDQQVDLSNHPDGMYLFRVNGVNEIIKVIKH